MHRHARVHARHDSAGYLGDGPDVPGQAMRRGINLVPVVVLWTSAEHQRAALEVSSSSRRGEMLVASQGERGARAAQHD
ncbi:MAG: hypothetical protein IE913_05015 [Halothiobacillus sp.]|nr:hypothetical protein [Halothiobacillus sp.]